MGVFWSRTRPSFICTWLCMSCDFTSSSCKCFFVVYAFFSWEALCYESCFVSHDVSIYCMMELRTSLQVSILHPRHHSSLAGLLGYFFIVGIFCINDVTTLFILFFVLNYRHLFFGTSLHSSFLVGDYVCDLSYKSNAFVWLEHFIRNIHTGKYLCINIWSCNYFSQ